MKKDLIEKKKELENQLIKINEEINLEILREDFEQLCSITDQLNSLFQNKIVQKYGDEFFRNNHNASDLIYQAMQILDKESVQLEIGIKDLEIELNKDENGK